MPWSWALWLTLMFALWPHCDELPGKSTTSSTTNRQSIAPWSTKAIAGGASKARGTGKDRGAGDSARPSAAADGAAAGQTREEGRARSTRAELPRSSKTTERKAQLQERQRENRREADERRNERKSDREADDEDDDVDDDVDDAGGERHALPSARAPSFNPPLTARPAFFPPFHLSSQVDLARITEEYQARRASKSAAEREAFTRSTRKPFEDLIDRIEQDFAQDEQQLCASPLAT
jgi:hypothetical protein